MKLSQKISLAIASLALTCSFVGAPALAAGSLSDQIKGQYEAGAKTAEYGKAVDPRIAIAGIIKDILTLLGSIFLVLTVYAGYNILTAAGDESKVEKAQKTIRAAVIGLIIVLAAYSITAFIGKSVSQSVSGEVDKPKNPPMKWSDLENAF